MKYFLYLQLEISKINVKLILTKMKKLLKTLTMAMICIAMMIFVSCKKNNAEPSDVVSIPTVTTGEFKIITAASAICGGEVTNENGAKVTERGVCWGTESNPTLSGSHTVDSLGVGVFTSSIAGLLPETKYYVRAYAINSAGVGYGAEKSFTTYPENGMINGHEYIDLGLPSGLLWATCNVGADASEGYGDFFSWGETTKKDYFGWDSYKWCDGSYTNMTKYCTDSAYGNVDNKDVLEPSDDAASANWGGDWRMPTQAEWLELYDNTIMEWTNRDGVNGQLFISKVSGSENAKLFLPAAGFCNAYSHSAEGTDGRYWLGSLSQKRSDCAYTIDFSSNGACYSSTVSRSIGHTVRPVSVRQK